jgi:hypothetical protein
MLSCTGRSYHRTAAAHLSEQSNRVFVGIFRRSKSFRPRVVSVAADIKDSKAIVGMPRLLEQLKYNEAGLVAVIVQVSIFFLLYPSSLSCIKCSVR